MRQTWLRLTQVVATISLIGLLVREIRWADLWTLTTTLRYDSFTLSIVLVLISHLINVVRWRILLQHHGAGYDTLLVFYGAGLFSNHFLPTGFGGDGIRVALLSQSVSLRRATFSVGLDRGLGLIALTAPLAVGLWLGMPPGLAPGKSGPAMTFGRWNILPPVLLLVAATGLLGWAAWCKLLCSRTAGSTAAFGCESHERKRSVERDGILPHKATLIPALGAVVQFTRDVGLSKETIAQWCRLLAEGYVLSVLSHLCIVAANWAVLQAVGIVIAPSAAIWLVLAVAASLFLPVAINGLGVQEATYVAILNAYGVASTPALLAALLIRLIQVLFGLVGGVGWLLDVRPAEISRT